MSLIQSEHRRYSLYFNARIAFNTAMIMTPTSAKMAAHMLVMPAAVRASQLNLMIRENTMFCFTMPIHFLEILIALAI